MPIDDEYYKGKPYRKRRKSVGDEILSSLAKDQTILDQGPDRGLRCRGCGRWQAWVKLPASYEMQSSDLVRLWWCPDCGDQLRLDNVTAMRLQQELDDPKSVYSGELRILVTGDRNWTDVRAISSVLKKHDALHTTVIHGAAKGADSIAGKLALRMGMQVLAFPAEWDKYHKAAGPIRNRRMLDEGKPDLVLAFHDDLAQSKGTAHMVKLAQRAGLTVRQYRHRP